MTDPKTQMKQTRDSILGKVAHLRGQLDELSRENAELAKQYRASRAECDALVNLKEGLLTEQRETLQKLDAMETQVNALKTQARELEVTIAEKEHEIKSGVADKERRLKEADEEHSRQIRELEGKLTETTSQNEKLRSELQTTKRSHNELTAELEELTAKHQRLEERHQRGQEEIVRLNEKNERLLEKLNRVEDENRDLLEKIQNLEQENGEQNRILEEMLQEFSGMEGTIEGSLTEITTATDSTESTGGGVELVAAAEVAWLKEKLESAEQRGDRLEKELVRLQAMAPEDFHSEKERLNTEIKELKIEAESRRVRMQDQEEKIRILETEQKELKPLADEAEQLRQELSEKKQIMTEAEQLVSHGGETEEKLATSRERIVALENELLARKRTTSELESRIETLTAEHRQQFAGLEAETTLEKQSLKKQVDELKKQLRDLLQQDSSEGLIPVAELEAAHARIAELESQPAVRGFVSVDSSDAVEAFAGIQEILAGYEAEQETCDDIVTLLADTFERIIAAVKQVESSVPRKVTDSSPEEPPEIPVKMDEPARKESHPATTIAAPIAPEVEFPPFEVPEPPVSKIPPATTAPTPAAEEISDDPAALLREAEHLLDDVEQAYKELLGE